MGSPVAGQQVIFMSPSILEAADQFRSMLFERVYRPVNDLPTTQRAGKVVEDLFQFFVTHPSEMQLSDDRVATSDTIERQAADVVAGMTDRFALAFHSANVNTS